MYKQDAGVLPHLALLCAALMWSGSFIELKVALEVLHPLSLMFLRMSAGSVCFILLLPWLRRGFSYHKGDWKLFFGMALCEPCLYFVFEGYALRYTSASQAGMVVAILPLLVAMGAYLAFKERLGGRNWAGFFVALAGVLWLSAGAVAGDRSPNPLLGNSLEMLAMLCATVYSLCVRRLCVRYSPLFVTAVQAWAGTVFFAPFLFVPGMGLPDVIPLRVWGSLFYLGVLVAFGAYGCYNYGISKLGAGRASVYCNLIPVFTLIMGIMFLSESLTRPQYLACAVVLGGVFLSQSKSSSA